MITAYGLDLTISGLPTGGTTSATPARGLPDGFAGGSVIAGLPYHCATSLIQADMCQY